MTVPAAALERALVPAAAIQAAVSAGLFPDLVSGGMTVADVAAQHHLDEHRAGVLLDVLVDAGVLDRSGDRYRADPDLSTFATVATESLRALDVAIGATRPGAGPHDGVYPHVTRPLAEAFEEAAAEVARRLAAPNLRVLDLGAGAAPWSIAILHREPIARLTALDLPEVTPVLRHAIAEAGLEDRATVVDGDLRTYELPTTDLAVLAHVLHLFDPDAAASMVHRAADSLDPDGCLAVIEPAADPADAHNAARLRSYELGLFTRTSTGQLHDLATITDWCADAGLAHVETHQLPGGLPMSLLLARAGSRTAGGST